MVAGEAGDAMTSTTFHETSLTNFKSCFADSTSETFNMEGETHLKGNDEIAFAKTSVAGWTCGTAVVANRKHAYVDDLRTNLSGLDPPVMFHKVD